TVQGAWDRYVARVGTPKGVAAFFYWVIHFNETELRIPPTTFIHTSRQSDYEERLYEKGWLQSPYGYPGWAQDGDEASPSKAPVIIRAVGPLIVTKIEHVFAAY